VSTRWLDLTPLGHILLRHGNPAPDALKRLVDHFDQNRKVFLPGDYKEEQLRAEFLNPFFTALGWDIDSKRRVREAPKQEVGT
jgi:hypothetical protein